MWFRPHGHGAPAAGSPDLQLRPAVEKQKKKDQFVSAEVSPSVPKVQFDIRLIDLIVRRRVEHGCLLSQRCGAKHRKACRHSHLHRPPRDEPIRDASETNVLYIKGISLNTPSGFLNFKKKKDLVGTN